MRDYGETGRFTGASATDYRAENKKAPPAMAAGRVRDSLYNYSWCVTPPGVGDGLSHSLCPGLAPRHRVFAGSHSVAYAFSQRATVSRPSPLAEYSVLTVATISAPAATALISTECPVSTPGAPL